LDNVLYVGRPAFGQESSTISLFKLDADGKGELSGADYRLSLDLGRHPQVHAAVAAAEGDAGIEMLRALLERGGWRAYAPRANVFIEPDAQGRGVGRVLFDWALATAAERGYDWLEWESDPNAAGFYEKMGGEKIGETKSTIIEGRVLPMYRMPTGRN